MDANNQDGVFVSERFLSQKGQKGPLRMHQDSSQVSMPKHTETLCPRCSSFLQPYGLIQVQDLLFNTVRGVRDRAIRQGKKPVDHTKANRKAISEQSKQNARSRAVCSCL